MTLAEIKQVSTKLLKQFDFFCHTNHLRYFISNGTLLGAVKYQGFIPWDDDIDVLMPRPDYDKLIDLFRDTDDIKLFSNERECLYKFPFAKMCDMNTVKIESYQPTDRSIELGVSIDIFPLDDYSNNKLWAMCKIKIRNIYLTLFNLSQIEEIQLKNPIKKTIYKLARKIGFDNFSKHINLKHKVTFGKSKYVANDTWPIYGSKEVFKHNVFSEIVLLRFEGEYYPGPMMYDQYLNALYGDYKKDPPIEEQISHHAYKAYWKRDNIMKMDWDN